MPWDVWPNYRNLEGGFEGSAVIELLDSKFKEENSSEMWVDQIACSSHLQDIPVYGLLNTEFRVSRLLQNARRKGVKYQKVSIFVNTTVKTPNLAKFSRFRRQSLKFIIDYVIGLESYS